MESLLEDQPEIVTEAIRRAEHIHARVGHAQGPQITDPRLPEWKRELDTFTSWWQRIIDKAKAEKRDYFTITPEFGPHPYLWNHPDTGDPIRNQWEINNWMKSYLQENLKV